MTFWAGYVFDPYAMDYVPRKEYDMSDWIAIAAERDALKQRVTALEAELAALREQVRWVPVAEQRPKLGKTYLTWSEPGGICRAYLTTIGGHENWYYALTDDRLEHPPTHLRLLPTSPELQP